ncbi:MAG: efflux RND transporter periplasmic adaptor subunit [Bacteroidetes bacterium]|nr:MAG: efflux RND transporter periplasmic adaptor subunit [Bacteroidota bacterium]
MVKKIVFVALLLAGVAWVVYKLNSNAEKIDLKSKPLPVLAVPVSVETAKQQSADKLFSVIGIVTAQSEVLLVPETSGKALGVFFQMGDMVSKGKLMVQVDDELRKANYESVKANYEKVQKDLQRFENLLKEKATTELQVDNQRFTFKAAEAQYITAKRQLADTKVLAPISGYITMKNVEVGSTIQPTAPIATIVDISQLKIKANVAEKSVFKIKIGDKVQVTTDIYQGVKFEGRVSVISVKGDEAHNYPIEITLNNDSKYPLKAGMFGVLNFNFKTENALVIPRDALVGSAKNPQVYVLEGNKVALKDILLGEDFGGMLEVLQGVKEGEQVVTNGQINLRNGVEVVVKK